MTRQAPLFADLLSATLASGATMRTSLSAASEALGDPTRAALRPVVAAIDLGADPLTAWRSVPVVDAHAPIVEAVARSADSGASASDLLARIAVDLRRDHAVRVQVAARAAGVRAVVPLAACFLPAFLLLGVVPVVASLAQSLVTG
jgi:Flp pilus assembly protein TadB